MLNLNYLIRIVSINFLIKKQKKKTKSKIYFCKKMSDRFWFQNSPSQEPLLEFHAKRKTYMSLDTIYYCQNKLNALLTFNKNDFLSVYSDQNSNGFD